MSIATRTSALHDALAAVAPIAGVSIVDWSNKATWIVQFLAGATQAQKDAAAAVITGYDFAAAEAAEAARVAGIVNDPARVDLVNRIKIATTDQITTWLANNTDFSASQRVVIAAIVKQLATMM